LRVLGQVIEQRGRFVEEQRQVILDTRRCNPAAQVLEDRAATEVDIEALTEARLETGDRVFLQGKLAGRQQANGVHLVDGTLVFRIEGAQRLDFVVEQVDPEGQFAAHREQIDQRAAHGEFTVLIHRVDIAIAAGLESGAHLLDIELLADVQNKAAAEQEFGRRQAMQGCGDRHHQYAMAQLRQPV